MTTFRTMELISGIVTGLLAFINFFLLMPTHAEFRGPRYFLAWFLAYGLPGALTVSGAYFHGVRRKSGALVVVGIATVLSTIFILLNFFGGVIGYLGVWAFLHGVAPAMMSILTGVCAFAVVRFEKPK